MPFDYFEAAENLRKCPPSNPPAAAVPGKPELPALVGIAGHAGVGKDTLADQLVRQHGFKKMAFAGLIKSMLDFAGLTDETLWDDRQAKEAPVPPFGLSPRRMAQALGDWGRGLHQDFWLHRVRACWRAGTDAWRPMVISDVRYENEAAWIRSEGGVVVHVKRPVAAYVYTHTSEQGVRLDARDIVLVNDRDIIAYLQCGETLLAAWPGHVLRARSLNDATPEEWDRAARYIGEKL